jgi:multidrug efflux pump subunit AcrB
MNLSEPFIRRPVMTTLTVLGLSVFGIMAYRQLAVSDLPNVDYPTIQVSAALRGGTPETMAAAVATPLERAFSTIAGLESMNSASAQGSTQITLQFALSRDLDAAALDVQAAIARAMRNLPAERDTPPSYQKVNPADQPILYIALTSPTLPLYELDEYAQTYLAQNISMVEGVAQVAVYGSQKYAVRVQLNPQSLAVRGIGLDEVARAIQSGNVNLPTGILYGPTRAFAVQANGQLSRAKDFRSLVVAYRNGAPVRLEELGLVLDSVENDKVAAWYCTHDLVQRSIVLAVQRQPGMNTVEVADNVQALLKKLNDDLPAALDGSKEISFTIVSMTVSLAAVFIPVLFMGGVVGRLFREFAVTIGAAVLVSGVIALTVIPMLSDRFVSSSGHGRHGRLYQWMEGGFEGMKGWYASSLNWALDHCRTMMGLAGVTLIATGFLFWAVPKGFMASEDRGRINIATEAIEGISFESMVIHQNQMVRILQEDPNVQSFMSSVGARGSSGGNSGRFLVSLKPREDRRMTTDQVIQSLRSKLSGVAGIRAFPVNPPLINIGGRSSKSQYQYTLSGTDTAELYRSADRLVERLRELDILQDVTSDLQLKNPELNVEIDRDLASSMQISADQIETALFNAYGSRQISTILTPNNQYSVILEMLPFYQAAPSVLSWLHIRTGDGKKVPVNAVARLKDDVGPVTINHTG